MRSFQTRRLFARFLAVALASPALAAEPVGILHVKNGLLMHFDAAKGVAGTNGLTPANGSRIQRWADQATDVQGDNVALPEDSNIGAFYLNSVPELNGRPALDFRNGELMTAEISMTAAQVTWFVVFRADFSAEDRVMEFTQQASTFVSPTAGGRVVARGGRVNGGSSLVDATLTNLAARKQEFFIQSVRRSLPDNIDQRLIDRAGQVLTASATGANANQNLTLLAIGGQRPGGTLPYAGLLTGQIAEILVYNRTLTPDERLSVEAYLSYKFFGPPDSDADTLPDAWEQEKFGALGQPADGDADGDLLTNRQEFDAGFNPAVADGDGDGLDDSRELAAGTSPASGDTDGDGAKDPVEGLAGTHPSDPGNKPSAIYAGLIVHSDFESVDADRFTVRNLAGPGDGVGSGGAPVFRAPGVSGEAIRFSGSGGLDWGPRTEAVQNFSVSLAFRPGGGGGIQYLASQGNRDLTRPGWSIFLDDGEVVVRAMNASRTARAEFRHPGPLDPDGWHVVSFSCDADGRIVPYLDGQRGGWSSSPGALAGGLAAGPGSTLLTGMSDLGAHGFPGSLDEFSIWNRVLSDAEMAMIQAGAAAGRGLDGKVRNGAPPFSAEPRSSLVFSGQGFQLGAVAPGAQLQWLKNGGILAGQSAPSLLVSRATAAEAGRYQAVATFPDELRPTPEVRVTVADFAVSQFLKTRANATRENELWIQSMAFEGDGLACGIPSFNPGDQQRGQVRFLRRSSSNPDTWSVAQTISPPSSTALYFGSSVVMKGNTLMIGAPGSSVFGGNRYGRVFVYQRSSAAASWSLQQEIPSPVQGDNDDFGESIALEGDTLAISAPGDMKAFVFGRTGSTWSLRKQLSAPLSDGRTQTYGTLALQGDVLIIGESRSSLRADNGKGVVHIHRRDQGGPGQWGLVHILSSAAPASDDLFGRSVALDAGFLAVSNRRLQQIEFFRLDPVTSIPTRLVSLPKPAVAGVPGEQPTPFAQQIVLRGDYLLTSNSSDSERGSGAGSVFLFRRDPGTLAGWSLLKRIAANDIAEGTGLGSALAMQGNEIFAAASENNGHPVDIGALYGFRTLRDTLPDLLTPPRTLADSGALYQDELRVRVAAGARPVVSAASPLPAWLTLQNPGPGRAVLTGTPPPGTTGDFPIRLRVTEPSSLPVTRDFILHVSPGNLAPLVLRNSTDLAGPEDSAGIEADLRGVFVDGEDGFDSLAFEIVSPARPDLFESVTVGQPGGMLVITPVPDANGSADLVVRTRDRGNLPSEATFRVTVLPVNDPPQAAALPAITADPDARPVSRSLSPLFTDADIGREGDRLVFSIAGNTAPELFATTAIDADTGLLDLSFADYRSGEASLTIRATDQSGVHAESLLRVTVPAIPAPSAEFESSLLLNRQTGLREQTLTFTNRGQRAIGGFDVVITGLPAGVVVNNASDHSGDVATIAMRRPLGVGESVTIVIEYFVPDRGIAFVPRIALSVTLPEAPRAAAGEALAIERSLRMEDGAFLIEFSSVPGNRYEIQYSDGGGPWKASPAVIRAAGNRLQWIDRGPPRTETPPTAVGSRFYRVKELGESP